MSTKPPVDPTERLTQIYNHAVDALDAFVEERGEPVAVAGLRAAEGGKAIVDGSPVLAWRKFRKALQYGREDIHVPEDADAYGIIKLSNAEAGDHPDRADSDAEQCREAAGQYLVQDRFGISATMWTTPSAPDPVQTSQNARRQCGPEWVGAAKDRIRAEVINPAREADGLSPTSLTRNWESESQ